MIDKFYNIAKKYNELETLRRNLNEKITEFIKGYYKEGKFTPYLNNFLFNYLERCRYTKDDVRPLLTKLGYEINKEDNDLKDILPAMASIHSILLGFIPIDDIIDGVFKEDFKKTDEFAMELALAYSLSTKFKEGGRNILRRYYGNLPNYSEIDELISMCIERLDGSHTFEINFHHKIPLSDYSIEDYIKLIDEATSVFIATAFTCGGLIAGINERIKKAMWEFGIALGRLCQIRDDFLDYVDSKITGKLPFADLFGKRKRFPLLIAYKIGSETEKKQINEILHKKEMTINDIVKIMELISSAKVKKESRNIILKIKKEARKKIALLPQVKPVIFILFNLLDLFSEL